MPRQKGASIHARSLAQLQSGGKGELAEIHNAPKPAPARPCQPHGPSYIGCQKTCAFFLGYNQRPMVGCVFWVDEHRRAGVGLSEYRATKEAAS